MIIYGSILIEKKRNFLNDLNPGFCHLSFLSTLLNWALCLLKIEILNVEFNATLQILYLIDLISPIAVWGSNGDIRQCCRNCSRSFFCRRQKDCRGWLFLKHWISKKISKADIYSSSFLFAYDIFFSIVLLYSTLFLIKWTLTIWRKWCQTYKCIIFLQHNESSSFQWMLGKEFERGKLSFKNVLLVFTKEFCTECCWHLNFFLSYLESTTANIKIFCRRYLLSIPHAGIRVAWTFVFHTIKKVH